MSEKSGFQANLSSGMRPLAVYLAGVTSSTFHVKDRVSLIEGQINKDKLRQAKSEYCRWNYSSLKPKSPIATHSLTEAGGSACLSVHKHCLTLPSINTQRKEQSKRYKKDLDMAAVEKSYCEHYNRCKVLFTEQHMVEERKVLSKTAKEIITMENYMPKSVTCDLSVSLSNCPELKLGHEDYDKDTHKKAHYQRPSRKPLGAQDNGKMTWLSGHAMLHENFRKSKQCDEAKFFSEIHYIPRNGLFPLLVAPMDADSECRVKFRAGTIKTKRLKCVATIVYNFMYARNHNQRRRVEKSLVYDDDGISNIFTLHTVYAVFKVLSLIIKWKRRAQLASKQKRMAEHQQSMQQQRDYASFSVHPDRRNAICSISKVRRLRMPRVTRSPFLRTIHEKNEEESSTEFSKDSTSETSTVLDMIGGSTSSETLLEYLRDSGRGNDETDTE